MRRIKFAGSWVGRDGDSHDLFVFSTDGLPGLYGEFFQMWAPNRNDYNLEFGTFGFFHKGNFGNPDPNLRQHFSAVEVSAIEQRLRAFAHDPDTFPKQFRVRPQFQGFLGGVSFRPDWIIQH
jgi:hypothetical protein